jgi:hypothetical protein
MFVENLLWGVPNENGSFSANTDNEFLIRGDLDL